MLIRIVNLNKMMIFNKFTTLRIEGKYFCIESKLLKLILDLEIPAPKKLELNYCF
jgi:hypothetical protein